MARPSEFELAIDGSVLRQPLARWIAVTGMIVILVLSLLQLLPLADYGRPVSAVVAGALGIGLVVSVIPVLVIRWIDRREPEPWFMVIAAFLWGGVVAAALTSFVTDRVGGVATTSLGVLFTEPVLAETVKGLGLLAILLLLRDEFNGIRDGFVYGALIGLGYTWYSTAQAVGDTFARTGDANWLFEFLTHYPLLGLSGDTLFAAVLGTAVGIGMQQHDRLKAALWIAGGYLAAVLAHVLWAWLSPLIVSAIAGGLGVPVSDRTNVLETLALQPAWIGWVAVAVAAIVIGAPFFVAIYLGLRFAARQEHRMLLDRLADEADDIVTAAERERLEATAEPPRGAARRVSRLQNELATRKAWLARRALDPDTDRHVEAYREELRSLR